MTTPSFVTDGRPASLRAVVGVLRAADRLPQRRAALEAERRAWRAELRRCRLECYADWLAEAAADPSL